MAKAKAAEQSISGWFRKLYRDEPQWLAIRSNADVEQRWKDEHPGEEFTERHRQALANVKSSEKKRQGIGKRRKKRQAAAPVAAAGAGHPGPGRPRRIVGDLEDLELAIDRCLTRARAFEEKEEGMQSVVNHLRAARNDLILLGK